MPDAVVPPSPDAIDEMVNAAFRFNARLVADRDDMVRDLGLTSARWQVLAEVARSPSAPSAAGVARQIGLSRQAVQRTANELATAGMVLFSDDPEDRRSQRIAITDKGRATLTTASARQQTWLKSFGKVVDEPVLRNLAALVATTSGAGTAVPDTPPPPVKPLVDITDGEPVSLSDARKPQPRRVRAFEGVSDYILNQIKAGALAPGDKLPAERDFAAALSVGRPAVREALRSLEISGILRFERGVSGGAFVRETGPDGMAQSIRNMLILGRLPPFDLNEVRSCILGQSARLGAQRGTEADFAAIEQTIDEIEARGAIDDPMATVPPVVRFYRLVGASSHNPVMILLVDAIADVMREMLEDLKIRTTIDVITPRREMLAAMRAGRPDDAERAIRVHFEETGALLLGYNPLTSGGWVRTRRR